MNILVTGAAGFIGSRVAAMLAERGDNVTGLDNINDYYDPRLKHVRLAYFNKGEAWRFVRADIADRDTLMRLVADGHYDCVVNLAAQAGVRYSITNPYAYHDSNLTGFLNILEACRHHDVPYLVYASSSSVYGLNTKTPFSEDDKVVAPVSLYAATKKANELMAHAYSKLYGLRTTGLRYFTVYGPWGRPDMAPMLFADAITQGRPIKVFNNGDMQRDFTYIDDIAKGTIAVVDQQPQPDECPNAVPANVYNIGCGHPTPLLTFISEIETALGRKAEKQLLPMQPGDVHLTYADTTRLQRERGYRPQVLLHEGITHFIDWFQSELNPLRNV